MVSRSSSNEFKPLLPGQILDGARFITREEALELAKGDDSEMSRIVRDMFGSPNVDQLDAALVTWPDGVFGFLSIKLPSAPVLYMNLDAEVLTGTYYKYSTLLQKHGLL